MDPSPFWARSGQEWICTLFRHSYPKTIPLLEIPPLIYLMPTSNVFYSVHYLMIVCYLCITSNMYIT